MKEAREDSGTRRPVRNPWPRFLLAGALMVWAGANLWTAIFGWDELVSGDPSNRSLSFLLTILVTALPGALGSWLLWSVVVGPDDPRYNKTRSGKN